MEFKINTYNEDYIIIDSSQIIYNLARLQIEGNVEDNELIETLNQINISINNYKRAERAKGNLYKQISEVAIDKNSRIGKLIMNKFSNPEYLYISHFTNALLKSIDSEEWDYYAKLTVHVKHAKKFYKIDYQWFKLTFGEDIANYIVNSMFLYPSISREDVYLYQNEKIEKTKLPEKRKAKTKARTK